MNKTDEKTLQQIKKYNQTPKGKATRKRYYEAHKEHLLKYNKEYLQKRREIARRDKICFHCLTKPQTQGTLCDACRARQRTYLKSYKETNKTEHTNDETQN